MYLPLKLVNAFLRITVKALFRFSPSVHFLRRLIGWLDGLLGLFERNVPLHEAESTTLPVEWISQEGLPSDCPVILYLPGGGYVMRTPHMHRSLVNRLCAAAGAKSLLTFYRLAPEHPFPDGLIDAVRAYYYLLDNGITPDRIVIAGDSAGGGLTLATLLKLRGQGDPLPAGAVVFSPVTDLSHSVPSRIENRRKDPLLYNSDRVDYAGLYCGDTPRTDPLVSPLFGDWGGMPPLSFYVSDTEVLRDDSIELAKKVNAADGRADVTVGEGLPHVWPLFRYLRAADQTLAEVAEFVTGITE